MAFTSLLSRSLRIGVAEVAEVAERSDGYSMWRDISIEVALMYAVSSGSSILALL